MPLKKPNLGKYMLYLTHRLNPIKGASSQGQRGSEHNGGEELTPNFQKLKMQVNENSTIILRI